MYTFYISFILYSICCNLSCNYLFVLSTFLDSYRYYRALPYESLSLDSNYFIIIYLCRTLYSKPKFYLSELILIYWIFLRSWIVYCSCRSDWAYALRIYSSELRNLFLSYAFYKFRFYSFWTYRRYSLSIVLNFYYNCLIII